eukprot:jgi/Mesvir1/19816/Mv13106-RA.1
MVAVKKRRVSAPCTKSVPKTTNKKAGVHRVRAGGEIVDKGKRPASELEEMPLPVQKVARRDEEVGQVGPSGLTEFASSRPDERAEFARNVPDVRAHGGPKMAWENPATVESMRRSAIARRDDIDTLQSKRRAINEGVVASHAKLGEVARKRSEAKVEARKRKEDEAVMTNMRKVLRPSDEPVENSPLLKQLVFQALWDSKPRPSELAGALTANKEFSREISNNVYKNALLYAKDASKDFSGSIAKRRDAERVLEEIQVARGAIDMVEEMKRQERTRQTAEEMLNKTREPIKSRWEEERLFREQNSERRARGEERIPFSKAFEPFRYAARDPRPDEPDKFGQTYIHPYDASNATEYTPQIQIPDIPAGYSDALAEIERAAIAKKRAAELLTETSKRDLAMRSVDMERMSRGEREDDVRSLYDPSKSLDNVDPTTLDMAEMLDRVYEPLVGLGGEPVTQAALIEFAQLSADRVEAHIEPVVVDRNARKAFLEAAHARDNTYYEHFHKNELKAMRAAERDAFVAAKEIKTRQKKAQEAGGTSSVAPVRKSSRTTSKESGQKLKEAEQKRQLEEEAKLRNRANPFHQQHVGDYPLDLPFDARQDELKPRNIRDANATARRMYRTEPFSQNVNKAVDRNLWRNLMGHDMVTSGKGVPPMPSFNG